MILNYKKLNENLPDPRYAYDGDSGFDLCSASETPIQITPNCMSVVPLGIIIELPAGYELQLRPRSGLAKRYRITLQDSPATIDSNYRGELFALVSNEGEETFEIRFGDRICQGVVVPVMQVKLREVDEIQSVTDRGENKFGSSGYAQYPHAHIHDSNVFYISPEEQAEILLKYYEDNNGANNKTPSYEEMEDIVKSCNCVVCDENVAKPSIDDMIQVIEDLHQFSIDETFNTDCGGGCGLCE